MCLWIRAVRQAAGSGAEGAPRSRRTALVAGFDKRDQGNGLVRQAQPATGEQITALFVGDALFAHCLVTAVSARDSWWLRLAHPNYGFSQ